MVKLFRALALFTALLVPVAAFGQAQINSGHIWANPKGVKAPPTDATVIAILDLALGSTRGALIERGASGWGIIGPSATAGLPFVSAGAGADPLYQILGVVGGGTGINTYTIGDIIAASGATTLSKIVDVAVGSALISGGVGVLPSWGKITSAHLNITTTTCTNQFLTAISATGTGTCTTDTLASAQHANQGTTTTVLHGNAAGNPAFGQIVVGDLAASLFASTANYYAGTSSTTLIAPNIIYTSEVTVTFSATPTFDFSTFINARITLTANITSITLTGIIAGKAGHIVFKQSGAGSFTAALSTATNFKWAAGTVPSLTVGSTTAEDVLFYDCTSTTVCYASLSKDMK